MRKKSALDNAVDSADIAHAQPKGPIELSADLQGAIMVCLQDEQIFLANAKAAAAELKAHQAQKDALVTKILYQSGVTPETHQIFRPDGNSQFAIYPIGPQGI